MGPKTNKKGAKNVRPTLGNSFLENVPQLGVDEIEKLRNLLLEKLKNIYPPAISTKQVMDAIEVESKSSNDSPKFSELNKRDRKEKYKERRKELRHSNDSSLNFELRKDVTIGLKKCLKELSANRLCVLIFDSTVNLEPMRCLFEKGISNSPTIIGIPKLGECVKKPLGFSAICLGFDNAALSQNSSTDSHYFYPIVEFINSVVLSETKYSKSICDIVSKGDKFEEIVPATNKPKNDPPIGNRTSNFEQSKDSTEQIKVTRLKKLPKIEILYRNDITTRVFVPGSKIKTNKREFDNNMDFISFSESPNIKKQKLT